MLRIGMFLGDRYEILEKIGSGGMSDVYKAKCHKLNRNVAVKVLKTEFSTDTSFVIKFKKEAQSAAGLSHPNIVNIFDVGDEGDVHYIVMELIEGITLKDYIQKKGRLEIRESIGIAIQVAQGIAAAHEQHIVHRDIKPQNIIISRDGKIKVTDFGIARAASSETINSNAIGSVHYISPEQARGGYCSERSDLYSLGITLYEMVTGRLPYEGDTAVAVAVLHLTGEITPPSSLAADIPVSLEQIILKCTEKKQERRYASAFDLIADLKQSLLTPEDSFVRITPFNDTSPTTILSQDELAQIKEGAKLSAGSGEKKEQLKQAPLANQDTGKKGSGLKLEQEAEDPSEDVNPKLERILNMVGIGAAVLIIGIVVVIIGNMTQLFGGKKPSGETDGNTTENVGSLLAADEVIMPDLKNLTVDEAEAVLIENNLGRKWKYANSDSIEKDRIMEQEVEAGAVVKKHKQIEVTISQGPASVDIAKMNLLSMTPEDARAALEEASLKVEMKEEYNDTVEKDKLIRYEPSTGVKKGDTIQLYKSLGVEIIKVKVPNLSGLTEQAAKTALSDEKLLVGVITREYSTKVEAGKVISQATDPNTEVDSGTKIDFIVSEGLEPAPEKTYKYYSTLKVDFDTTSYFGPGTATEIQIAARLKQVVNGETVYRTLTLPATIGNNQKFPIVIDRIEGAYGVEKGEVEVYNIETLDVLQSYSLTFEKTEVN